jgi:hypothetical protein
MISEKDFEINVIEQLNNTKVLPRIKERRTIDCSFSTEGKIRECLFMSNTTAKPV